MNKWQYLELNNPTLEEQNKAGNNKWELIWTNGTKFIYKRELK